MKNKIVILLITPMLLFTISVSESFPKEGDFPVHTNPFVLNGKSIDFISLSNAKSGKLGLITADLASGQKEKVAFLIYLKREGKIINPDSHAHNAAVLEFELSEIYKSAKVGDQIIIDPVDKDQQVGRRVIVVQPPRYVPQFLWFKGLNKDESKC